MKKVDLLLFALLLVCLLPLTVILAVVFARLSFRVNQINRCIATQLIFSLDGKEEKAWKNCINCKQREFCSCIEYKLDDVSSQFNPFVCVEAARSFVASNS